MFPCLHTVCLACANELCQHSYASTFSCPTCRQPVPTPSKGASGLPTNLDVRNMVEIIQKTKTSSMANPDCSEHPSRSVSNICVTCKVGLCTKCFTSSAIKQHSDHRVLEINDAFDEIKETCDTLAEKGREVCKLLSTESRNIETKKRRIERLTTSLLTAQRSKNLGAFDMIQKLSTLLDETPVSADNQRPELACDFNLENFSDRSCTAYKLKRALDGLGHGKLLLESYKVDFSPESVVSTKLASATVLLDVLRLKLYGYEQDSVVEILAYLWSLSDESESCCQRLVFLGATDLLVLCFEAFKSDPAVCRKILGIYSNLADYHSLHENLISSRVVDMLMYCIQKFAMSQSQVPERSCSILSSFMSNGTLKWPHNCTSKENVSIILAITCEGFSLTEKLNMNFASFEPMMSILSQEFSEAAKYWAVWVLYMCINKKPDEYCPMLIRDGGVSVLQQQSQADEYVQRLSKMILAKLGQHGS